MRIRISARAQADFDGIFALIYLRQSPQAAERFLELAQEAGNLIAKHPLAGPHPHWAARHKTLRFWVISRTKYLIYYIPDNEGVSIERALDGRRDVSRMMELGLEYPPEWE